jgi:hypothetical protein
MKKAEFWAVASSGLVEVHRSMTRVCCSHRRPDDGGSMSGSR